MTFKAVSRYGAERSNPELFAGITVFPAVGEDGVVYADTTTVPNKLYRWDVAALAYVPMGGGWPDVFRIVQPLVAGNNVITHGLGSAPVEVEVRNAANGAVITHRVVVEAPNAVTISVAVAVGSARVSVDA